MEKFTIFIANKNIELTRATNHIQCVVCGKEFFMEDVETLDEVLVFYVEKRGFYIPCFFCIADLRKIFT